MDENTTTYESIAPRVRVQAIEQLLRVGIPRLTTQRFAQMTDAKKKAGDQIKWRRYHALVVDTAPLAEGITPDAQPLLETTYTAILQQYGAIVPLTDVAVDLHPDSPLDVAINRCGQQLHQTIEKVTIEVLRAGTNVYFPGTATTRATVNATLDRGIFREIERGFNRNDCTPISDLIAPSSDVSTMGIDESYFVMAHTDLNADFKNIQGWQNITEYSDVSERLPGEIGCIDGRFRVITTRMFEPWQAAGVAGQEFLSSGNAVTSDTACDVYPVIVVGKDAYGAVRLQGYKSVNIYVLQPGVARDGDGIAQRGSVGWKTYYACAILHDYWIARAEVAATASLT